MRTSSYSSDTAALLIIGGCILAAVLAFSSCKDDKDDTAPEITLNGDQTTSLFLQSTWTDPGAVAIDDNDGVVDVTISGTFNVNKTGTYYLTYIATDVAGNTASATRTINVTNELTSSSWVGNYTCEKDSAGVIILNYTDSLGYSQTLNKNLAFMKFGNRAGADKLFNFEIDNLNAVVPYNQTIAAGSPSVSVTYDGAGITVAGPPEKIIFTLNETTGSTTNAYTYIMTKN